MLLSEDVLFDTRVPPNGIRMLKQHTHLIADDLVARQASLDELQERASFT